MRKRIVKEIPMLKAMEGKLFYSKTYQSYVVVQDSKLWTAELNEYIESPNEDQTKILVQDLAMYLGLVEAMNAAEETIQFFGLGDGHARK